MKTRFILGLRNLRRNFRRSCVTGLSIGFGFAAIALFAGYTANTYRGLEIQAVHGELLGHLTIGKKNLRTAGRLHPEKYLLTPQEIDKISALVQHEIPGAHIARRLSVSGMISNGRVSTIFVAQALAPQDMEILRGPRARASGALDPEKPTAITIAQGLAQILGLKDGDDAALLLSTIYGQANAADASVSDIFSTGIADTEDKFLYLPLEFAQSLYDAPGRADRLTVLLPDAAQTTQLRALLAQKLDSLGLDLEVSTWQQLSNMYRPVKGLFDMIFGFLLSIVLVIVAMSVANAMAMSVVERTRETGTFRAMGMRDSRVVSLFVTEAFLLVLLGCAVGLVLTLLASGAINAANLSFQPPSFSERVPLSVGFDAARVGFTALALCLLSVLSAFICARSVTRQKITDALAHV